MARFFILILLIVLVVISFIVLDMINSGRKPFQTLSKYLRTLLGSRRIVSRSVPSHHQPLIEVDLEETPSSMIIPVKISYSLLITPKKSNMIPTDNKIFFAIFNETGGEYFFYDGKTALSAKISPNREFIESSWSYGIKYLYLQPDKAVWNTVDKIWKIKSLETDEWRTIRGDIIFYDDNNRLIQLSNSILLINSIVISDMVDWVYYSEKTIIYVEEGRIYTILMEGEHTIIPGIEHVSSAAIWNNKIFFCKYDDIGLFSYDLKTGITETISDDPLRIVSRIGKPIIIADTRLGLIITLSYSTNKQFLCGF